MNDRRAKEIYDLIRREKSKLKPWESLTAKQQNRFRSLAEAFEASVSSEPEFIVPPPTGTPPGGPPKP